MRTKQNWIPDRCRQPLAARLCAAGLLTLLCLVGWQAGAKTLAYWRFEASDPAADSSGNGNVLTLNNAVSSGNAATNAPAGSGSLFFNGTDAYAVTTSSLLLAGQTGLTVEFFVQTNGQSDLGFIYEDSADANSYAGGFYFDFNEEGGCIKSSQGGPNVTWTWKQAPYPKDGAWHHYAVTYSEPVGGNVGMNLYIDGVLQVTNVHNLGNGATKPFNDYPFYIGSRGGSDLWFNGTIGAMRISNRILPPAGFLNAPPLINAVIGITQQPTNTTVLQNAPVTFSVGAVLTNGDSALLEYQWRTNGVDVPGATASTFGWAMAPLAADGVQVSVEVSVSSVGGISPVTSATATLHVTADTVPPVAMGAFAQATTVVGLLFNKALDPVSANDPTMFTLDGGAVVSSAQLMGDGRTVVLGVSPLTAPTYTVSYNVTDLAGNRATGSLVVTNMGFSLVDIGNAPQGMLITTNAGGFTIIGGGADIWGANDGFNFVYKQITGDFDMRLRINNILPLGGNASTRGGLMVRETLDANSRNVAMLCYGAANNNWVTTWRATTGGPTAIPSGGLVARASGFAFPNAWVRLKRSGQSVAAYYSTNSMDWTQCGTSVSFSGLPDTVMVGMASDSVSSTRTGVFQYADYQQFSLSSGSISIATQPSNTTVLAYRPATFTVGAALLPSNLDQSLLSYQWLSNGVPIDGANDMNFTFALPAVTDSGSVFRCVVSAPGVAPVTSAAATLTVTPDTAPPVVQGVYSVESHLVLVQFDEPLDPNTANSFWLYTVDGGFSVYNAQLQADGRSVLLTTDGLNAPTFNLTITGVTDLSGNALTTTAAGANAGMTMADINDGLLMPSQMTSVSSNGFTVSAVGTDIFANQDSFNFVYEWLTNDFDVRVQFVNATPLRSVWARGGLMARQDGSQGSPNVFVGTYVPGGEDSWAVTERPVQDADTYEDVAAREASFAFPNAWLRLKRSGQQLSAYESLDGYNWTQLGANITDMVLPDALMVGIASCPVSTMPTSFEYANYGATPPLPHLEIQAAGGNVVISWTANSAGFALQQSDALAGGVWTDVTNVPVLIGGRKEVTLPAVGGAKFYHLKQ